MTATPDAATLPTLGTEGLWLDSPADFVATTPASLVALSSAEALPLCFPRNWPAVFKESSALKALVNKKSMLKGIRCRAVALGAPAIDAARTAAAKAEVKLFAMDSFSNAQRLSEALGWQVVKGFVVLERPEADAGTSFVAFKHWWNATADGVWIDLTPALLPALTTSGAVRTGGADADGSTREPMLLLVESARGEKPPTALSRVHRDFYLALVARLRAGAQGKHVPGPEPEPSPSAAEDKSQKSSEAKAAPVSAPRAAPTAVPPVPTPAPEAGEEIEPVPETGDGGGEERELSYEEALALISPGPKATGKIGRRTQEDDEDEYTEFVATSGTRIQWTGREPSMRKSKVLWPPKLSVVRLRIKPSKVKIAGLATRAVDLEARCWGKNAWHGAEGDDKNLMAEVFGGAVEWFSPPEYGDKHAALLKVTGYLVGTNTGVGYVRLKVDTVEEIRNGERRPPITKGDIEEKCGKSLLNTLDCDWKDGQLRVTFDKNTDWSVTFIQEQ